MGDHEEVDFGRSRYQVGYFPKLLPSLTAEWLEHVIPVPGVIGSNPEVSGVITEKVILAAGLVCPEYSMARACLVFRFYSSVV